MKNKYKEYKITDLKLMFALRNDGFTYQQIAEKFERPWEGVKKAINRYKKMLREQKKND